jgi:hypothetical protein
MYAGILELNFNVYRNFGAWFQGESGFWSLVSRCVETLELSFKVIRNFGA